MPVNLNQYKGTEWGCSITGKIFTVSQVISAITKHYEFTVISYF